MYWPERDSVRDGKADRIRNFLLRRLALMGLSFEYSAIRHKSLGPFIGVYFLKGIMREGRQPRRYRSGGKFYHMCLCFDFETMKIRLESIEKYGLLTKCFSRSYNYDGASRIWLSKDSLHFGDAPYSLVFEVDVRGIRDYDIRWGCMEVYEDIPPERLRLLSWDEAASIPSRSFTTSPKKIT